MISMMITLTLLAWAYVVSRFVPALGLRAKGRVLAAIVLLLIAEYYAVLAFLFGSYASINLPQWVMVGLQFVYISYFMLFILLLLRDLVGGVIWLFARQAGKRWLVMRSLSLTLAVVAVGLSAVGVWQAIKVPAVKTLHVTLDRLPPAFDGYRLVLLADLHAHSLLPASWQAKVVEKTNALQADAIVISGDLQDGQPAMRKKDVLPMANFAAKDGVFVAVGNHEYYADYVEWVAIFREMGMNVLENDHAVIARGDAELVIAGLTDRQADRFNQAMPDIQKALEGAPVSAPVILLAHRPDGAPALASSGVDLMLTGHTHGGQVLGLHYVTQWANEGFVSGWYQLGSMRLYVTNGTGVWNGFAVRLGRPAEITEMILHAPGQ